MLAAGGPQVEGADDELANALAPRLPAQAAVVSEQVKCVGGRTQLDFAQDRGAVGGIEESHVLDVTEDGPVGLALEGIPPQPLVVVAVHPYAPAVVRRVQVGSQLMAVNGVPVQTMSRRELCAALRPRPLRLHIQRDNPLPAPNRIPPRGDEPLLHKRRMSAKSVRTAIPYEVEAAVGSGVLGLVPSGQPPDAVRVASVFAGSLAEAQGVQVGDELMAISGRSVKTLPCTEINTMLGERPLILRLLRPIPLPGEAEGDGRALEPAGLGVYERTFSGEGHVMGIIPSSWPPGPVTISGVVQGSAAAASGVRVGDSLLQVDGERVAFMSKHELTLALRRRPVLLQLMRGPGQVAALNGMVLEHLTWDAEIRGPLVATAAAGRRPSHASTGGTDGGEPLTSSDDDVSVQLGSEEIRSSDPSTISDTAHAGPADTGTVARAGGIKVGTRPVIPRALATQEGPARICSTHASAAPSKGTGTAAHSGPSKIPVAPGGGSGTDALAEASPAAPLLARSEGAHPGDDLEALSKSKGSVGKSASRGRPPPWASGDVPPYATHPAMPTGGLGEQNLPGPKASAADDCSTDIPNGPVALDADAVGGASGVDRPLTHARSVGHTVCEQCLGEGIRTFEVVASQQVKQLGLVSETWPPEPVHVSKITSSGWAEDRGVLVGDELVEVDGEAVATMSKAGIGNALKRRPLRLRFTRRGRRMFSVVADASDIRLGFVPAAMPPQPVLVEKVERGSWAERSGVAVGDELVTVDRWNSQQLTASELAHLTRFSRPLQLTFARASAVAPAPCTEDRGQAASGRGCQAPLLAGRGAPSSASSGPDSGHELLAVAVPKTAAAAAGKTEGWQRFDVVAEVGDVRLGFSPAAMPPEPVVVARVEPGNWAEKSGVKVGDELFALDGHRVERMAGQELVGHFKRTRPLRLAFRRAASWGDAPPQGQQSTGAMGAEAEFAAASGSAAEAPGGFELVAGEEVARLGLSPATWPPEPVVVKQVSAASWAATQRVLPGDEIVEVNGKAAAGMTKADIVLAMKARPLRLRFTRKGEHAEGASGAVEGGVTPTAEASDARAGHGRLQSAAVAGASASSLAMPAHPARPLPESSAAPQGARNPNETPELPRAGSVSVRSHQPASGAGAEPLLVPPARPESPLAAEGDSYHGCERTGHGHSRTSPTLSKRPAASSVPPPAQVVAPSASQEPLVGPSMVAAPQHPVADTAATPERPVASWIAPLEQSVAPPREPAAPSELAPQLPGAPSATALQQPAESLATAHQQPVDPPKSAPQQSAASLAIALQEPSTATSQQAVATPVTALQHHAMHPAPAAATTQPATAPASAAEQSSALDMGTFVHPAESPAADTEQPTAPLTAATVTPAMGSSEPVTGSEEDAGEQGTDGGHVVFELLANRGVAMLGWLAEGSPPQPVHVGEVIPASWAVEHGLQAGDSLLTVNGRAVGNMSKNDFDEALKLRPLRMQFARERSCHAALGAARFNPQLGLQTAVKPTQPVEAAQVRTIEPGSSAANGQRSIEPLQPVVVGHLGPMGSDDRESSSAAIKEPAGASTVPELSSSSPLAVGSLSSAAAEHAPQVPDSGDRLCFAAVALKQDVQLGFWLAGVPPQPVVIGTVLPGTWAERVGIAVGDQLCALNGQSMAEVTEVEFIGHVVSTRPLHLTFARAHSSGAPSPAALPGSSGHDPQDPVPIASPTARSKRERVRALISTLGLSNEDQGPGKCEEVCTLRPEEAAFADIRQALVALEEQEETGQRRPGHAARARGRAAQTLAKAAASDLQAAALVMQLGTDLGA